MPDMRRFLDLAGLEIYDAKIKTVISTGDAQALADAKKYFDDNKGLFEAAGAVKTAQEALQAAIDAVDAKVNAIKDGTNIDSFADVEAALAGKQNAGDYATKAEAQGYANAKDEAIAAAQKAGDDAQNALDAYKESNDAAVADLTAYVGTIPADATATNVVAYVQEKTAGIATEGAMNELGNRVTVVEGDVATIKGDYLKASDKTALEGQISAVQTAVDTEKSRAEGIEGGLRTDVDAIKADYLKAADKTELQNNIDTLTGVVETLRDGIDADKIDGLNDLIEWADEHAPEVNGIKTDIEANAEAIEGVADRMTTAEGQISALEGAVATKAEQTVVDGIGERLTTAEGKITTLEGKVETAEGEIDALQSDMEQAQTDIAAIQEKFGDGEGSVADMIADAVAAETSARETAVAGVQANVDTLSETVATKADASVVTAIDTRLQTAEGEIDTLQSEMDAVEAVAAAAAKASDLTALTTRVGTAESEIDTLQSEMDAVEGRLDDAEDAIADKADASVVDALTTRVGTAEANIAANSAALAKITEITETEINALFA